MKPGGFLCMVLTIPGFVLCWVLPTIASHLLHTSGQYTALVAQAGIATLCFAWPWLGVAGTVLATAITYGLHVAGADHAALVGSTIWAAMTLVNWGVRFPYSPSLTRLLFWLDMSSYFETCELRGDMDSMPRSRTLFMFHPHGVITAGFSCNGIFSREFHERTLPAECRANAASGSWSWPEWPGTVFLLTSGLREPCHYFKVLCDLTGRMESATRANMKSLMSAGRNVALIPGGFEEATLFEFGAHRVAMRRRKGVIKYALQHGYALQPIYTFGESRTYTTYTGMKSLRLWVNRLQVPTCLFWGDWLVPLFPRREAQCVSYVGAPLRLPRIESPTPQQVEEWHAAYLAALQKTFDEGKAGAGEADAVLEVW